MDVFHPKTNQKRALDIALIPKYNLICGVVENSLRSDTRPLHPQINLDFGGDMTGQEGVNYKISARDKPLLDPVLIALKNKSILRIKQVSV
jgi:hypothetical protein